MCLFCAMVMAASVGKKTRGARRWGACCWLLLLSLSLVPNDLFALAQDVDSRVPEELWQTSDSGGNQTTKTGEAQNPWEYLSNDDIVRASETKGSFTFNPTSLKRALLSTLIRQGQPLVS